MTERSVGKWGFVHYAQSPLPSFVGWLGRRSLVATHRTSCPLAMVSVFTDLVRLAYYPVNTAICYIHRWSTVHCLCIIYIHTYTIPENPTCVVVHMCAACHCVLYTACLLCMWSPPPGSPFAVGPPSSWCSVAMRPSRAGGAWWVLWTLQRLRKRTPTGGRGKGTGGGRVWCIVIAHVAWIEPSTVLCRTCWGWGKLTLLNIICTLCT